MPPLPGVPSNISLLNGPMLLGNLFAYGLFGILTMQMFAYAYRFPNDPRWMKALVWGVYGVDVLITVFGTITAWKSLAAGWGDTSVLAPLDWPFGGLPFLSGLVASSVHLFFCWRMWRLQKSYTIPAFIVVLSFVSWGTASYCGIHGRQLGILRIGELEPYVIVWLGGSSLCDVLITAAMVSILFRAGSKLAFHETSDLVGRLITLTVETGMITTFGALAELILFIIFPKNNMHFLPFFMLAKLYSNTLLATLNSRGLTAKNQEVHGPALWNDKDSPTPYTGKRGLPSALRPRPPIYAPAGVHVEQVTEGPNAMEMIAFRERDSDESDFDSHDLPVKTTARY